MADGFSTGIPESLRTRLRIGVGSARRAVVSLAMVAQRGFLHRHLDAERGRRLADDAADHVAINGQPGDGGRHFARIPGRSSCRRAGGHG